MNRKLFTTLLPALALLCCTIGTATAKGKSGGWTACDRTAGRMYLACRADGHDDYNATLANCLNLSGHGERAACYAAAREGRREHNSECREVRSARLDACDTLGEDRYGLDPLLDPALSFIDPDGVPDIYAPNPFVSIAAGHTYVLRAGEEGEETVVVHVTEETREILGVQCRVVVDIVLEAEEDGGEVEYEAVEVTDDWFAQDTNGDVFYCGEIARNYEDGILRDLDGSFEAGMNFAKSGVLIRAFPVVGEAHRQEFSLGEAEDIIQYLDLAAAPGAEEGGDNPAFPCSPGICLRTFDFAPIDPSSTEFKYYLPGVGFVLAVALEDGEISGEREERVCGGDSLAILSDPACDIADPEALLDTLCTLAPDTFCAD